MDIVESNISLLINAKTLNNVVKDMLKDAFIHVFIITWEIVNMDSIVTSHTPSEDKLLDQIHNLKLAKSYIMKTFVLLGVNAKTHMI